MGGGLKTRGGKRPSNAERPHDPHPSLSPCKDVWPALARTSPLKAFHSRHGTATQSGPRKAGRQRPHHTLRRYRCSLSGLADSRFQVGRATSPLRDVIAKSAHLVHAG
jgi:hypothetical protein